MKTKKLLLMLIGIFLFSVTMSQPLEFKFAKSFGGAADENSHFLKKDQNGNFFICGEFTGSVDFDPSPKDFTLTSSGEKDIYISKFNNKGDFIWAIKIGGNSFDYIANMELDLNGDLIITGTFNGTCDFDPSASVLNYTSKGSSDIFICKIKKDGQLDWAKQIGNKLNDVPKGLAIDKKGDIIISGSFTDSLDFDPSPAYTALYAGIHVEIFIFKFSSSGDFVWVKQLKQVKKSTKPSTVGNPNTIDVDNNGNIYCAGLFSDSMDFNPGAGDFIMSAEILYDGFLLKLDASGNFIWAKNLSRNFASSLKIDPTGNVIFVGIFLGTIDVDPGPNELIFKTIGAIDISINNYDPNGNMIWAKQIGSRRGDGLNEMAIDKKGDIYLTGYFLDSLDFDPNSGIYDIWATGRSWDIFICKLLNSGDFSWAAAFPGASSNEGYGIDVDEDGNVFVNGIFMDKVDFDPGMDSAFLESQGGKDVFIVKLGQKDYNKIGKLSMDNLKAYPNPSEGKVNITLENYENQLLVKVSNTYGQLVKQELLYNTKDFSVELPESSGMYFIEVSTQNKSMPVLKIMKN